MSDYPPEPSKNPYAAPTPSAPPSYGSRRPGGEPGRGYVRQIPILGIMTIVQGALLTLMGLAGVGYGILFAVLLNSDRPNMPPGGHDGPPLAVFSAVGFIGGTLILTIAIMQIIAGIRTLKYRGRTFTIVTWIVGLLASLTCYCAPTSMGLAIWGLIVFMNPAVVKAFKMAESGMKQREIEDQYY